MQIDAVSPTESILALLHTRLAEHLVEESEDKLLQLEIVQILRRPYSSTYILKVVTDRDERQVVLKQIAHHPLNAAVVDDPDQAAVEFGVLEKIHPRFADIDRCSVPRPILLIPEFNAYLMEYVKGHVLSDRLNLVHYFANRARFRQLQQHFHDCGRWLSHFQSISGRRLAPASAVDNVVLRCHDRLKVIEEANDPACPRNFRQLATGFIERQVTQLANKEVLVTGRHGDFGPWNVLAGPGGVTVIDFFGHHEDPLPVDILSMQVFLESQRFGLANSAYRVHKLQESFLAGYGPVPKLSEPLILLCEAQQRILQIAGRIIYRNSSGFNKFERTRSLRVNVEWFLAAPEESSIWPR